MLELAFDIFPFLVFLNIPACYCLLLNAKSRSLLTTDSLHHLRQPRCRQRGACLGRCAKCSNPSCDLFNLGFSLETLDTNSVKFQVTMRRSWKPGIIDGGLCFAPLGRTITGESLGLKDVERAATAGGGKMKENSGPFICTRGGICCPLEDRLVWMRMRAMAFRAEESGGYSHEINNSNSEQLRKATYKFIHIDYPPLNVGLLVCRATVWICSKNI